MNKIFCLFLFFCLSINCCSAQNLIRDDFIENRLAEETLTAPETNFEYDFSDTDFVTIPLRISETITTAKRKKSHEGQELTFIVDKSIYYKNKKIVSKGTTVTARLEIMTTKGFAGVPAEIFITDFKIPNLDSGKIVEPVSKRGFSTTALIMPIKWALTPFPPTGNLTNIFMGFNAKLTPKQILEIQYYPNY